MPRSRVMGFGKQNAPNDSCHRNDAPPKTYDYYLPIGPFKMWLAHLLEHEGMTITELTELIQLNERTIRRIMGTRDVKNGKVAPQQQKISIDMVDWALTKADGATQMWHLYPEVYENTDSDIEISS